MRSFAALVLVIAVLGAGCAKPEAQVIGKWQVDPASFSTGNAQQDAMTKSFASAMSLEFKADKTFTGPMMEGTYEVSGHTVTMKTTKMMGMDISKLGGKTAADATK